MGSRFLPSSVLALMVCVFGVTTGEFVIAGILPAVANDLRVPIGQAGLLVTAYALGMIVGGPLLTAVTTRFARKPLVVALLVVAIAGNLASAVAPTYGVLFAARVVTALVTSTFFANAIVIAASTATADRQASTVAKLAFGMNLAMIVGAPVGTVIGGAFGWRSPFVAIAVCCAVGLLLVVPLVPSGQAVATTSAVAELKVFRSRDVQLALAISAVANLGVLMVFTYFAPLLTDLGGFQVGSIPALLLVYGVGATVGNLVGGWLADRSLMPSQLALLSSLAVLLVALWLFSGSALLTVVLVFVLGAVAFAVIPGMQIRVMTTASAAPTLALAVNASAYQVAAAFAGWLGGVVIAGPGLRTIYLTAAATTVGGLALSAFTYARSTADRSTAGQAAEG